MQLQPDIIVTKLSQTTEFGKTLLCKTSDPDLTSALRLDATVTGTITTPTATPSRYEQTWNSRNLFGTFRYTNRRYSVVKRRGSDYHSKEQECEEMIAQYYGPSWLTNRTWRIRAVKTSFDWSFSPQTYNIIPSNSPVFHLVEENNVKGLQELFSRKEASPFDCDINDFTPLTVSITIRPAEGLCTLNASGSCLVPQV